MIIIGDRNTISSTCTQVVFVIGVTLARLGQEEPSLSQTWCLERSDQISRMLTIFNVLIYINFKIKWAGEYELVILQYIVHAVR